MSSKSKTDLLIGISQIQDNQFILEGNSGNTRIGGESEYSISYIDIENGPYIHIGKDFFGRGLTRNIEIIETNRSDYLIVKITVDSNE